MSQDLKRASEVPEAHAYVLADDSFMSGWGGARNAINTIVLPVASNAEAEVVYANVRSRPEMRRARIVVERPAFRRGHTYSLMTRATAPRWYEPDAFMRPRGGKGRAAVGGLMVEPRRYECEACGHRQTISTNHTGACFDRCGGCSWKGIKGKDGAWQPAGGLRRFKHVGREKLTPNPHARGGKRRSAGLADAVLKLVR